MKYYLKVILLLVGTTILFQGFQCSSREMTTAKLAIQNNDIPKAVENLQREIDKNPQNAEAYILLAELKVRQGDHAAAAALMDKAEPLCLNDPTLRDKPAQFKYNQFKTFIENGQTSFTRYSERKESRHLDTAIKRFTAALTFRPFYAEAYRMIAVSWELLEKPDSAEVAYLNFIRIMEPSIYIAVKNNFFVGSEHSSLTRSLGAGKHLSGWLADNKDSIFKVHYQLSGKDLFIQFIMSNENNIAKVSSWSYDPPINLLREEREVVPANIVEPIIRLATIYYYKQEKETSLKYFKMASSISPYNDNANSSIVTLLQELGRSQEAVAAINENVKKNPENPTFITQLGDVYMYQEDYDKAIELYEQALAIDPNFASALRNAGACYGLKAAKIQQEQNELQKAGTIKTVDINTYLSHLVKAAEYLTRALNTNEFKNDPDILGDLCGIYHVIPNEKANFEKYLKQLEDLESTIPQNRLEAYYLRLYRIYSVTGNPKMNDIEKKLN